MDLTILTDMDLHDLAAQISAEWERRSAAQQADKAVTEVVTGLQADGKLPAPEAGTDAATAKPWVNPGTLHELMYHEGDVVTHGGKVWTSRHPLLNHWEPGTVGVDARIWEEVTPDVALPGGDEPQAWAVGAGYSVGDEVTYQGVTYKVIQAHTSAAHWPPDQVASLYTPT